MSQARPRQIGLGACFAAGYSAAHAVMVIPPQSPLVYDPLAALVVWFATGLLAYLFTYAGVRAMTIAVVASLLLALAGGGVLLKASAGQWEAGSLTMLVGVLLLLPAWTTAVTSSSSKANPEERWRNWERQQAESEGYQRGRATIDDQLQEERREKRTLQDQLAALSRDLQDEQRSQREAAHRRAEADKARAAAEQEALAAQRQAENAAKAAADAEEAARRMRGEIQLAQQKLTDADRQHSLVRTLERRQRYQVDRAELHNLQFRLQTLEDERANLKDRLARTERKLNERQAYARDQRRLEHKHDRRAASHLHSHLHPHLRDRFLVERALRQPYSHDGPDRPVVLLVRDSKANGSPLRALKRVALALGVEDDTAYKRLRREQGISDRLWDQRDIIRIYETGVTEPADGYGQHGWLLMEFIEHGDLQDFLSKTTVTMEWALEASLRIARALTKLHSLDGVFAHADVKLRNVLVRTANPLEIVITDFGIAAVREELEGAGATQGQVPCTMFSAPLELARDGARAPSVDVSQLGFILYEMLTGWKPYELEVTHALGGHQGAAPQSRWQTWRRLLEEHDPSPICTLNPSVPDPVRQFVLDTTSRLYPAARPTLTAAVERLHRLLRTLHPSELAYQLNYRALRDASERRWLARRSSEQAVHPPAWRHEDRENSVPPIRDGLTQPL